MHSKQKTDHPFRWKIIGLSPPKRISGTGELFEGALFRNFIPKYNEKKSHQGEKRQKRKSHLPNVLHRQKWKKGLPRERQTFHFLDSIKRLIASRW